MAAVSVENLGLPTVESQPQRRSSPKRKRKLRDRRGGEQRRTV